MSFPQRTTLKQTGSTKFLPAVVCKSSKGRKEQIKTVPFMMAARGTLVVTQTIYTKARRLKGTETEEAGHRAGQEVEGFGVCVFDALQESWHVRARCPLNRVCCSGLNIIAGSFSFSQLMIKHVAKTGHWYELSIVVKSLTGF